MSDNRYTVAYHLAAAIDAAKRCDERGNTEWSHNHRDRIAWALRNVLPHGSGIDGSWTLDDERSSARKLVLCCSYHHMDENGFYDGWTDFTVTVTPSFHGVDLRVSGQRMNTFGGPGDSIHECMYDVMTSAASWTDDGRMNVERS